MNFLIGIVLVVGLASVLGCRDPSTVTNMAINAAQGEYTLGVVCGHVANYYCDCSGLVSYAWGLPAPAIVTQNMQTNYCAKLGNYNELMPGDAILKPDQHVEMFIRWQVKGSTFIEAGCHNTAEGCSHREVPLSNYVGNGYFGCRPHAAYVCGGSYAMLNGTANSLNETANSLN